MGMHFILLSVSKKIKWKTNQFNQQNIGMMTHFTLEISFPTYTIECLRKIILQNALCGAHGSVVISFRSVTQMLLVQTPLWSLDVMFCALRQGTLSTLS